MDTVYDHWSLVLKYAQAGIPFAQQQGQPRSPLLTCRGQVRHPRATDGWHIVANAVDFQRQMLNGRPEESLYLYLSLARVEGQISAEDVCMVFYSEEEKEEEEEEEEKEKETQNQTKQGLSTLRFTSGTGGRVTGDALWDFAKKQIAINVHLQH